MSSHGTPPCAPLSVLVYQGRTAMAQDQAKSLDFPCEYMVEEP